MLKRPGTLLWLLLLNWINMMLQGLDWYFNISPSWHVHHVSNDMFSLEDFGQGVHGIVSSIQVIPELKDCVLKCFKKLGNGKLSYGTDIANSVLCVDLLIIFASCYGWLKETVGVLTLGYVCSVQAHLTPKVQFVWLMYSLCSMWTVPWARCPGTVPGESWPRALWDIFV